MANISNDTLIQVFHSNDRDWDPPRYAGPLSDVNSIDRELSPGPYRAVAWHDGVATPELIDLVVTPAGQRLASSANDINGAAHPTRWPEFDGIANYQSAWTKHPAYRPDSPWLPEAAYGDLIRNAYGREAVDKDRLVEISQNAFFVGSEADRLQQVALKSSAQSLGYTDPDAVSANPVPRTAVNFASQAQRDLDPVEWPAGPPPEPRIVNVSDAEYEARMTALGLDPQTATPEPETPEQTALDEAGPIYEGVVLDPMPEPERDEQEQRADEPARESEQEQYERLFNVGGDSQTQEDPEIIEAEIVEDDDAYEALKAAQRAAYEAQEWAFSQERLTNPDLRHRNALPEDGKDTAIKASTWLSITGPGGYPNAVLGHYSLFNPEQKKPKEGEKQPQALAVDLPAGIYVGWGNNEAGDKTGEGYFRAMFVVDEHGGLLVAPAHDQEFAHLHGFPENLHRLDYQGYTEVQRGWDPSMRYSDDFGRTSDVAFSEHHRPLADVESRLGAQQANQPSTSARDEPVHYEATPVPDPLQRRDFVDSSQHRSSSQAGLSAVRHRIGPSSLSEVRVIERPRLSAAEVAKRYEIEHGLDEASAEQAGSDYEAGAQ